ncbi:aldehyde dehydrogenase family protein [Alkalicoccus chagannorensis]|uniref:aldehyde dehydrogenase family protein n=1 Tax=Alkalicoccus chagannorensis TaxID=427072 RepID=UPI000415872B|nr:aldehyde dehydrogenase family protein [Alkalicoccus chagannorensis]
MQTAMNLISNQHRDGGSLLPVTDPGNPDDVLGHISAADKSLTDEATASAHDAWRGWKKTDPATRGEKLLQAAEQVEAAHEPIARLTTSENGMPIATTRAELTLALSGMRFFIEEAASFSFSDTVEENADWVTRIKKSKGVIACIVPWNAPIVLTLQKVLPALLTGNTVVVKPSPLASLGVTQILEIIAEALPDGVLNIVQGDIESGRALSESPLVRMLSFTGGGSTAKHIMRSAADNLKHVHFELGGNDPALVLDDADPAEAATTLMQAAFRKSGQYCFAPKRIYVADTIYDSFMMYAKKALAEMNIGHQLQENTAIGPLISSSQRDAVRALLQQAAQAGATITEMHRDDQLPEKGWFMKPALVTGVAADHPIVLEEPFGPILPVLSCSSTEDMIYEANRTEYGLGSSVWGSEKQAAAIAAELEAGFTFINRTAVTPFGYRHLPFGGVKQSGIGRENTAEVFDEFVQLHAIHGSRPSFFE